MKAHNLKLISSCLVYTFVSIVCSAANGKQDTVSATERVNCSHGCNAEVSADADYGNIAITPPMPTDPLYTGVMYTDGVVDFPAGQFHVNLKFDFVQGTVVDVNIVDSGFFEEDDVPGGAGEDN